MSRHLVSREETAAGRLWPVITLWSVGCGVVASGRPKAPVQADELLTLAVVLLLVVPGWGVLWEVATGTDWRGRRAARQINPREDRPEPREASTVSSLSRRRSGLPYTQPESPAARIGTASARLGTWWRVEMWPVFRAELLALLPALVLVAVLALLLPSRLVPMYAAMAALAGLGLLWCWRQRALLAAAAVAQVGLPWLAGHLALDEPSQTSAAMALCFTLAAWGLLRVAAGRANESALGFPAGLWLLNGGLVLGVALLAVGRETWAGGVLAVLIIGQVALQPSLRSGEDGTGARSTTPGMVARRAWPWLMAAMVVAAVAVR